MKAVACTCRLLLFCRFRLHVAVGTMFAIHTQCTHVKLEAPRPYHHPQTLMGVGRNFSRGVQKYFLCFRGCTRHSHSFDPVIFQLNAACVSLLTQSIHVSRAKSKKVIVLANFRDYILNSGTFSASAGGASKKFGAFRLQTVYDVIIFKFQGGASAPPCTPLPAPMNLTPL